MIITYKAQDINFSDDVNALMCQIDSRLSRLAYEKIKSERFGYKINLNIEDIKLLYKYRDVLRLKLHNNVCLRDFVIDDIISRVKQLLNRN